jgi:hypothetical protein
MDWFFGHHRAKISQKIKALVLIHLPKTLDAEF